MKRHCVEQRFKPERALVTLELTTVGGRSVITRFMAAA